MEEINQDIGDWFKDYLVDSGYTVSCMSLSDVICHGSIIHPYHNFFAIAAFGLGPDQASDNVCISGTQ